MRAHVRRLALALVATFAVAVLPTVADAAESRRGAIVRIEIQDDNGEKGRTTSAVWWGSTAELALVVGAHKHVLTVTPSGETGSVQLAIDHSCDGKMLADDEVLQAPNGRGSVVVKHGDSTVKLTIVPTQAHVDTK
jgi:hypothetical protein